jgi:hypothetical protein
VWKDQPRRVKRFTSDCQGRCYEGLIALPIYISKTPQRIHQALGFFMSIAATARAGEARSDGRVLSEKRRGRSD